MNESVDQRLAEELRARQKQCRREGERQRCEYRDAGDAQRQQQRLALGWRQDLSHETA